MAAGFFYVTFFFFFLKKECAPYHEAYDVTKQDSYLTVYKCMLHLNWKTHWFYLVDEAM
jgi:hypothetical protein